MRPTDALRGFQAASATAFRAGLFQRPFSTCRFDEPALFESLQREGDSPVIDVLARTQSWEPNMWALFWSGMSPLNLGLWGDVTQGVLWRLNSGQWSPGLKPKLVVLLIGTNNANWGSRPENTALGVAEIIRFINTHSPTTKILLIGILPRGEDATTPERAVNRQVNDLIMRCADGDKIVYMDPGQAMMDSNGRISNQVLFDYLHPTEVGYAILGGSIIAQVRKMMQK